MARRSTVGARELKTRLGTYLRRVRDGESLLVTERGIPVAELRSIRARRGGREIRLRRLEAAGLLRRPRRRTLRPIPAIRSRELSLATAVLEGREDRL